MIIQFIFVDVGQVLVIVNNNKLVTNLAKNSDRSRTQIAGYLKESNLIKQYREGQVTTDFFLHRLKSEIGYHASEKQLSEVWSDIFEMVFENIYLLANLKSKYKITLISNTNILHMQKIFSMIDNINFYDEKVLSYELGFSKPDPRVFLYALRVSNAIAKKSIFIDDEEESVAVAKNLGFIAKTLNNPAELKFELSSLGISI